MAGAGHLKSAMKKSRSPSRRVVPKFDRMSALDQALDYSESINSVAELLEACDVSSIAPRSINRAGFLIAEQARRLQDELQKFK